MEQSFTSSGLAPARATLDQSSMAYDTAQYGPLCVSQAVQAIRRCITISGSEEGVMKLLTMK